VYQWIPAFAGMTRWVREWQRERREWQERDGN